MLEEKFPQLDNHLINYLQFSRDKDGDPFKAAYLRHGAPEWQSLDVRRMRNRKAAPAQPLRPAGRLSDPAPAGPLHRPGLERGALAHRQSVLVDGSRSA